MTVLFARFAQLGNEATSAMVARLDTALQALSNVALQDVVLSKRLDFNTIRYELTLQYQQPGPLIFRAAYFSSTAGTTRTPVDAQVAAFFAAQPASRIFYVFDVSQESRRKLDTDAILVIYATQLKPNCGPDRGRPIIVEAVGNIAAGAQGGAIMVGADGLLIYAMTVVNRSDAQWDAGTRGYAQQRPGTCVWDGYPTCC